MLKIHTTLFFLLLVGCSQTSPGNETPESLLSGVDVTDGVNYTEAVNIAEAYFAHHVGCGAYTGVSNSPGFWVVEGKFGFAGDPIEGFTINKETGAIQSPVGPSYDHPTHMLRDA